MRMLITGAASGIGRAVAIRASETIADLSVYLSDVNADALTDTIEAVAASGARAAGRPVDLGAVDGPSELVNQALDHLGGLDGLISNAGLLKPASLLDLDSDTYQLAFDVNTRATWLLGKAAHEALAASGGTITATASISSEQPSPGLGSYGPSKAALVMLVRQMAVEWGPDGIRCNCVSPGPTFTGMTAAVFNDDTNPAHQENRRNRERFIPLRKIGTPQEVADTILFLAGPLSSQITGVNINVDGGQTLSLMPATGGGSGQK